MKLVSNPDPSQLETALLAGGCFWGMEDILRKIPGVVSTEVGYTGGMHPRPSYEDVKQGDTGHAESVRVVFDPRKLSYADLLEKCFFRMHDPTTPNRQGNDVGTQYRSAIFATTPAQKQTALADQGEGATLRVLEAPGRHRDQRRRPLHPRRGLPPGLPAEEPGRVHLPLHARLVDAHPARSLRARYELERAITAATARRGPLTSW